MNYEFPLIRNIADVLPAIEGRDEFVVAEKEGYTVINYNVMMADTFPDVCYMREVGMGLLLDGDDMSQPAPTAMALMRDKNAAIRRECRGIIFDSKTGEIIRRPFHKFFNVNEREETQDHVIDLSRPHAILEKLDGSMIAPFIVNGQMIWGTKMGATDVAKPVEEFVKNNPHYEKVARECIRYNMTPIFEWCSRKQRIVLDYKEDQLILTALRDMHTGEYSRHAALVDNCRDINIPVVRAFEPQSDMKAFLEYVHDLEDLEGFVVRFDDGHMLKLKCHWYLQIHKAKEAILQDRNIVEIILDEKLDDIKAHLPAEDRDRLVQFLGRHAGARRAAARAAVHSGGLVVGAEDWRLHAVQRRVNERRRRRALLRVLAAALLATVPRRVLRHSGAGRVRPAPRGLRGAALPGAPRARRADGASVRARPPELHQWCREHVCGA